MTLLLNRAEVERMLSLDGLAEELGAAFAQACAHPAAISGMRVGSALPAPGKAMVLMPGLLEGIPAYTVKVHAKYPAGQPAIQGVVLLHDLDSGRLLSILDSPYLTAARTGVAAAMATDVLARPDATRVAVIGAGMQGTMQLRTLAKLRTLEQVSIFDADPARAEALIAGFADVPGLRTSLCSSLEQALRGCDIALVATWAREPIIRADMLHEGMHLTVLGADEPNKCEIDRQVVLGSRFVCDDRTLAVTSGAIGSLGLSLEHIAAELGEVLAGSKPGRQSPAEVTVYAPVGLPFQDLVAAWHVYRAAAAGTAPRFDFQGGPSRTA